MNSAGFARALLDPAQPAPEGLTDPAGRPAGRRFDVYRNNVTLSLIESVETGFPATRKLIGERPFRDLARRFARAHPPQSPVVMLYGAGFPDFLTGTELAARYGYLPDVARLEYALRESYHSADCEPAGPAALGALPPERLMEAGVSLAPALRLVRSPWPVLSIWRANIEDGPRPVMRAEDVLVARPGWDPAPHLLPPGGGGFIAALAEGASIGAAIEAAGPELDLPATLQLLLSTGAIAAIEDRTHDRASETL